jgi:hypothetical protein
MRVRIFLLILLCSGILAAETIEDQQIAHARIEVDQLRVLVEAGAVPRAQQEKAEDRVADAQDAALLRKTIHERDLSEEQADEMVTAAGRRFDRRKKAFDEARKLVEAGVASQISLSSALEDLDLARKECDLAESRARLAHEAAEMAITEQAFSTRLAREPSEASKLAERFDGDGIFTPQVFARVETAFENRFGKPLPVSAMGETAVHRALGFDHRGRVDVALNPDQPEGVWLREFLADHRIPYFAFRHAIPGKATGAHIHMGPMSTRLAGQAMAVRDASGAAAKLSL